MRHMLVPALQANLLGTLLVAAFSSQTSATPHRPPSLLASSQGLIHPKRPLSDDPLDGLPVDAGDKQRHGKEDMGKGTAMCTVNTVPADRSELADMRAALAFVQHGPQKWPCPKNRRPMQPLHVRLTIQGNGKVTAAETVAGDPGTATVLARKLLGRSIPSRVPGSEDATVGVAVVTFTPTKR